MSSLFAFMKCYKAESLLYKRRSNNSNKELSAILYDGTSSCVKANSANLSPHDITSLTRQLSS
jgi:hypothetical protein